MSISITSLRLEKQDAVDQAVAAIEQKLFTQNKTLAEAIKERNLYFRVSLVGGCNLSCAFCHNEGAPPKGVIDQSACFLAIKHSHELGFRRLQFTGGEPLIHPKVDTFVSEARKTFADVGITTNGTYLPQKLDYLIKAGMTRLHVSLQAESLREGDRWLPPVWLKRVLIISSETGVRLRLNLPVPADEIEQAQQFLRDIAHYGCDIQVFSILPNDERQSVYPIDKLYSIIAEENQRRMRESLRGVVSIRGYRPPNGLRCLMCHSFDLCKEQSHSLRLGADLILRPCLASRAWDVKLTLGVMLNQIRRAALLALDYTW
jgi:GTP 3',8-cyclase